jgi:Ras and EF-hand domain-containing protein
MTESILPFRPSRRMSAENIQELISTKAEELFNQCDKEQKGFIIKKDMQRLRDELSVEHEQLEDVFDSLDIDHNGFLTLEEFTCKLFILSILIFHSLF